MSRKSDNCVCVKSPSKLGRAIRAKCNVPVDQSLQSSTPYRVCFINNYTIQTFIDIFIDRIFYIIIETIHV